MAQAPAPPPPLAPPDPVGASPSSSPPGAPADATSQTPEQRYRRGKGLFEYGECGAAVEALAPLAVPGHLQDERAQLDVHLMLGVCYALADKPIEASREFSSVLSMEPDFQPDPFLVPPAAVEVFERQRTAMKARLEELRKARERARENTIDADGGVLVERTTIVKDVPLGVAFMPFGLAQAANGENVKALVLGGAQGVLLASNVALFWTSFGLLFQKGSIEESIGPEDAKVSYQAVVFANLVTAVGFAIAYGYGVADALWNLQDGAVVDIESTRRALTPAERNDLQKVSPSSSSGSAGPARPAARQARPR